MQRFADRGAAGRALGERLALSAPAAPVVLGLPRGGVVVAAEVAVVLAAPLDVLVVRKLGLPWQPELAMGAMAAAGAGGGGGRPGGRRRPRRAAGRPRRPQAGPSVAARAGHGSHRRRGRRRRDG